MSKILTFVKNKIIDLINNDQIKYSRVIMIEESDSLYRLMRCMLTTDLTVWR